MSGARETAGALVAVPSQTVGPFFHFGLTPDGVATAVPLAPGVPRIELVVRVTDGESQPVGDAMIELWYAPEALEESGTSRTEPGCVFARLPTAADGTCTFELARPANPRDGTAAHVNVCVFARGLLRHLQTRIYFAGDPAVASDAVIGLVPEDRRPTLLATPDAARADRWIFHLRLQGPDETVFFDV